ncbi:hypothetical protein HDU98_007003 [Podochytrium sp. JEL0797]|nr:hypothetical protein HDU98_007003 [Podochytrium sp. JEL0797]
MAWRMRYGVAGGIPLASAVIAKFTKNGVKYPAKHLSLSGNGEFVTLGKVVPQELTLEKLAQATLEFSEERDWGESELTPRNVLLAMVAEVGELSEIFQWRGECAPGLPDFTPEDKFHVGEEMSDVLLYLVQLARICGIDLSAAVLDKMVKNAVKYPSTVI